LALTEVGCKDEETVLIDAEVVTMPTDEVLAQDSHYMARLFDNRNNGRPFLSLDLGDQRQYTFVLHRLLRAGKIPANSPRLFQLLSELGGSNPEPTSPPTRISATRTGQVVEHAREMPGNRPLDDVRDQDRIRLA
jgi:hypothetical protein